MFGFKQKPSQDKVKQNLTQALQVLGFDINNHEQVRPDLNRIMALTQVISQLQALNGGKVVIDKGCRKLVLELETDATGESYVNSYVK